MDEQTLSFLELTAMDDLVQLVADKRAAWLWSADGARILWANAAGASFFSAQSVADLAWPVAGPGVQRASLQGANVRTSPRSRSIASASRMS